MPGRDTPAMMWTWAPQVTAAVEPCTPRQRAAWAAACALLCAVPVWAADFPPIVDLPQHLELVRAFTDEFLEGRGGYVFAPLAPYSLYYALLTALSSVLPSIAAGKAMTTLAVGAWIAGVHLVAARQRASVASAVLASTIAFNHTLVWGYLPFILAAGATLAWVSVLGSDARRVGPRARVGLALGGVAIYAIHPVWAVVGAAAALLGAALVRRGALPAMLMVVAPGIAASVLAALTLPGQELFDWGYGRLPVERLDASWLLGGTLGCTQGPVETVVVAFAGGWALVAVFQAGPHGLRALARGVDRSLLALLAILASLAMLSPEAGARAISLATRWLPTLAALTLVTIPAPRVATRRLLGFASAVLLGAVAVHAHHFRRFSETELAGAMQLLAEVPAGETLTWRDSELESRWVKGRPFLQVGAYAGALHGARLGMTFADYARMPLRAKRLRDVDLFKRGSSPLTDEAFDYALVPATGDDNDAPSDALGVEALERRGELTLVGSAGSWQLWRRHAAGAVE